MHAKFLCSLFIFSPLQTNRFHFLFLKVLWAMKAGHLLWALLLMHSLWSIPTDGAIRNYYLGIQDMQWNYAPKGRNVITNQTLNNDT